MIEFKICFPYEFYNIYIVVNNINKYDNMFDNFIY